MLNGEERNSIRAPPAVGAYPHARKVGNFLYLSGIGPRQCGQNEIPGVELNSVGHIVKYDIEIQSRSVFNNVRNILEDCGSSMDRIFDVTVYLTNMKDDFEIYNQVYTEYFGSIRPCRTTVEVNALPTPIAIELKVVALIG